MLDVFPVEAVRAKFKGPVVIDQFGMPEMPDIVREFDQDLCNLALNVWNRIVQVEKRRVDPMSLASFINLKTGQHNPLMLGAIEQIIGEPVIKEIAFTHCRIEDDSLDDNTVARLFLARVYPNDLHIADVCYQNPFEPIPDGQGYEMQSYRGLGMLRETLERVEACARSRDCNFITLTAAGDDNYRLFSRYGFTRENNPMGEIQNAMEKKLR